MAPSLPSENDPERRGDDDLSDAASLPTDSSGDGGNSDGASLPTRSDRGGGASAGPPPDETAPGEPKENDLPQGGTLQERIHAATRSGGLTALPLGFGDSKGDWQVVRSEEPFEQLYLDPALPKAITPEAVARHAGWLRAFWQSRVERLSGAGRQSVLLKYDPELKSEAVIRSYLQKTNGVAERLQTSAGIEAELARYNRQRRERAQARLDPMLRVMTADGELSPNESRMLFSDGVAYGMTEDEVVAYVRERLDQGGLRAYRDPKGDTDAEQIQSVRWVTSEVSDRLEREEAERAARRIPPLDLDHDTVDSLATLAAYGDEHPDDFADAFYDGTIPMWIGGNLGARQLQKQLVGIKSEHERGKSETQRRGRELAIRRLLDADDQDSSPVVQAVPAEIDLGDIPLGTEVQRSLRLERVTARDAWGRVRVTGGVSRLTVDDAFEIPDDSIELHLDARSLEPSAYRGEIVVDVAGGDAVHVPVRYQVLPLEVSVAPERLPLGPLGYGARRTERVRISCLPSDGRIIGKARLVPEHPGIQIRGGSGGVLPLDGAQTHAIEVEIDTREFGAGTTWRSSLVVESNTDDIRVPIQFSVQLAWSTVAMWSAGYAAALAACFGTIRWFLVEEFGFYQWMVGGRGDDEIWMLGLPAFILLIVVGYITKRVLKSTVKPKVVPSPAVEDSPLLADPDVPAPTTEPHFKKRQQA